MASKKAAANIIENLLKTQADISSLGNGGTTQIKDMLKSISEIPKLIEENMKKMKPSERKIMKGFMDDIKIKTTEEYIFKEAFKK